MMGLPFRVDQKTGSRPEYTRRKGDWHGPRLCCFVFVLVTVYMDAVEQVLGALSSTMKLKLNDCLKVALELT